MSIGSIEGALGAAVAGGVLTRLGREGVTGILTLQSEDDIVAISLEKGLVVGADALNQTLEEGLGRSFVDEGLLTKAQFSQALAKIRSERISFYDALAHDDMLPRVDYLGALRRHTLALTRRACDWQVGDYQFYEGDEVSYEEGFEPIRVAEVASPAEADASVGPASEDAQGEVAVEAPDDVDGAAEVVVDGAMAGDEFSELAADWVEPYVPGPEEEGETADVVSTAARSWLATSFDQASQWFNWVIPCALLAVLVSVVFLRPNSLVYPFFWLESERLEFEKQRRTSAYLKIDRAARTFFLLEGRFPDDLHALVARGLLSNDDIVGSRGRILAYAATDRGYVIKSAVTDGTDSGVSKPEAIIGDFFLDPEFVVLAPNSARPPLILLD